ncbi:MAG: sodium-dependent transporter [Burkholderiales bacterium]|nr:sodium-dependent transporter [Burkholderiales bacterium]
MHAPAREQWASRAGFVLATLGCAVGLGNVWRFSYVAGENGGAAFLVAYVACVAAIGLPAMLAECALGGRARLDVVGAFSTGRAPRAWRLAGAGAVIAAFLILAYYSVVAGWAYKYFAGYATGELRGLPPGEAAARFAAFLREPFEPTAWHFAFMATTVAVVALGVARGIERTSRILVPLLGAIVLLLAGYAMTLPGAGRGLAFLFAPDWSALARPQIYLAALGQAFFSLGVGMGVLITYASYVREDERMARAAGMIAAGDTLFAVVAGVAIFPAVFAFGLDPAQGPALAFVTLPQVFALMPGGGWFAAAFFFLLSAAALTSAVSLLEVVAAFGMRRLGLARRTAASLAGLAAFAAGVPAALGSGVWREVALLGRGILEVMDYVTGCLLLPLGGVAVVVFVGWFVPRAAAVEASGLRSGALARLWLLAVRYLAPAAIAVMFVALAGA